MAILHVKNFGPVKEFKVNISKINILIGPQASGKSTIAKIIYYIQMFPTWLATFEAKENGTPKKYQFLKYLRAKFINIFGAVYHENNMHIEYIFENISTKETHIIKITQDANSDTDKNYISVTFDHELLKNIEYFFAESGNTCDNENNGLVKNRTLRYFYKDIAQKKIMEMANRIFAEPRAPIFIPAGRTLLTLLSGQINTSFKFNDIIMNDFLNFINDVRPQVGQGLKEIEEIAKKTWPDEPDGEKAALARHEIESILKGRYACYNGEERIYHESGYTKISVASSGQQEALWVILLAYMLILERASIFAIFEEPEAHLYPESQYAIVKLMALLANTNPDNQILITTHSPYILVAINNLLAASCQGKNEEGRVADILNKNFWLNINEINAFAFTKDGVAHNIVDKDLCMIKAEEIDTASAIMNEDYDKIMSE